jgi:conjugal transfer pilus assembly protein TraW
MKAFDLILCAWAAIIAFILASAPVATRAEDLGAIGPTYAIKEPHLLQVIERMLREKERSGELAKLQEEAKKRVVAWIRNPAPLAGIKRAERARTFYFDPTVASDQNIADDKGNVIIPAGTRKNPLDIVSLSKHLLFFDARDERQIERAAQLVEHYQGKVKPILVAGSYVELMKRWRTPVYFDQQGALVKKLGITQVPALVSQEGKRLRIDELVL